MAGVLQVGVARATITPPVGIQLVGFAGRGPSLGLHDDLHATALVAADGENRAALIACDLLGLDAERVAEAQAEIERRTGIPAGNVAICCTHTHYGPSVGMLHHGKPGEDVVAYARLLPYLLAGAVQEAAGRLRDARIGVGRGTSDIGINRREKRPDGQIVLGRNPGGPVDRELGVARMDGTDGRPIATLVNFACHAVCQSHAVRLISADFPGRTRQVMEGFTGAPCLYLQGACGNINPVRMEPDYEPARRLGGLLGCEATRVWESISAGPARGMGISFETLDLPALTVRSEDQGARDVAGLERALAERRAANAAPGSIFWTECLLDRARQKLESIRTGKPLPTIPGEVRALRLGPLVLATGPGEIFNEIGRAVKDRSPAPNTFFLGYTNGYIGYVPVPDAYPEGGYEVKDGCRVDPGAAAMIENGCLRMVAAVAGANA